MTLIKSVLQWYKSLPGRARLSINQELKASIPMAMVFGAMGNAYAGLAGHKALNMSDGMVALLQSMNQAGFVATGIGSAFLFKYRRSKSLSAIFILIACILASIYFVPHNLYAGHIFIVQVFLIQTLLAFSGSVRAAIWRKNYPEAHRAKLLVTSYLILTSMTSLSLSLYSFLMDKGVSFRLIYLLCAGAAFVTAWWLGKIRVSGEKLDLIQYNDQARLQSSLAKFFSGFKVLKDDSRFRRFMAWQMLNGVCCLSIEAGLVIVLARLFESRADITHKWLWSGTALAALPQLVCAFSSVVWARYYDKNDIFTSRAVSAILWSSSRVILAWGLFVESIPIIMFSRVATGVSMGLGQLAWRLGHMTFAPAEKDGLYMSAHQMLAGIRGMAAPFIGIYLLQFSWAGHNGAWLTLASAVGMTFSAWGFMKMRKEYSDLAK
ncbi:MAG: MFS transporter [Sedimentisphaerales bacterium]|nr:MFS transporter [Sedimentisphaerales bacterium]